MSPDITHYLSQEVTARNSSTSVVLEATVPGWSPVSPPAMTLTIIAFTKTGLVEVQIKLRSLNKILHSCGETFHKLVNCILFIKNTVD